MTIGGSASRTVIITRPIRQRDAARSRKKTGLHGIDPVMVSPVSQKVAVSVVYVAAMFMTIMDSTIVNVALSTICRTFRVPSTSVASVSVYYLVSLAVFISASGWLGDRFGGKRVLLTAIVVFTAASALCGFAGSVAELEIFRVLQGVGGGMMAPVGLAMLFRVFPPAERIRASAILTVPTTVAPALGPIIGGVLVTELSWRWVFFVNVPLGILTLAFGVLSLERGNALQPGPFDTAGFLLAGASLGLLMYGVSEGPLRHWSSAVVQATIASGAVLLALLVLVELRKRRPLIDLRLLGNRLFRSSNGVMILASTSFLGTLYVVSLFFQDGRGMSALSSGLSIFPEALGVMAGAQLASRLLYPVLGPRRNIALGLLGVTASTGLMTLVGAQTSLWWMRLLMFCLGVAMGQVFVPAQAAAFATISPEATGRASTMFNVIRQLGGAVGVAVLTTVIVAVDATRIVARHVVPNLAAYHAAFLVAAGVAAAGAVVALTIHDADAASTMVRRGRRKAEPGGPRRPGSGAGIRSGLKARGQRYAAAP
jgi:EmrB/QacA subfamily drug resistance transporter